MILAIDTAQMTYSIATSSGFNVMWQDINISLLDQIAKVDTTLLEGIVINTGPGRFSGIRSGIAFTLGLSRATGVSIYAVSHMEIAASLVNRQGPYSIALDARKNQAYIQEFLQGNAVGDITLQPLPLEQNKLYFGNTEGSTPIQTDAKTLLEYYNSKKLSPIDRSNLNAIYIRKAVE